ncbi:MAG TPA: phosphoribosylformylglycinamidine synthase subunit PurS [Saprospiraceae bacterium]|nr:phosphoribosylformylglycinamidine synthase subunit PurS [Saprospiraceae bacterium]
MKFNAEINVMPHKELLDPQGKTVTKNMKYIQLEGIEDVRIGKHIHMVVSAVNESEARTKIEKACHKILTNPIMESYQYTLSVSNEA